MRPLARTVASMQRSGIREIMDLAAGLDDVLHLEVGEPDFPTPPHILEAAARAATEGYTKYTANRGLFEVRESMVRKLERENGISVSPEQIVITTGAVSAISTALMVLLDPGDAVLIGDPAWPNYEMMVALREASVVRYPLRADLGFEPEPESIDELATAHPKAKVLLLNSPSNPTGAVFDRQTVERLLEVAEAHDLYVISDECYERIVFEGAHTTPASLSDSGRVVSCFSVSKSYAMTGWRIGYVTATLELADLVAKVQEALTSCATAVAQKAAQAALDGDQSPTEDMRRSYQKRRDLAVELLSEEGLLITRPKGAFYILASIGNVEADTYQFCKQLLTDHRVAVAPGETFGPSGRGMVRLSLASEPAVLEEGIRRLGRAVREQ